MADYYREYADLRRPAPFADPLLFFYHRRALKNARLLGLKAEPRILEIGYGHGYFAKVARDAGLDYRAVDMSVALTAEGASDGFKVVVGCVPPIPAECGSFDTIWMSHVLEHAKDWMHAREMLQACFDALPAKGQVCVICPDIFSWGWHFFDGDWSHGFPSSLNRVTQILQDVGFHVRGAHHTLTVRNPFLLDALVSLIPMRLIDAFLPKTYCHSFMTLMGWRQIMCVGTKH